MAANTVWPLPAPLQLPTSSSGCSRDSVVPIPTHPNASRLLHIDHPIHTNPISRCSVFLHKHRPEKETLCVLSEASRHSGACARPHLQVQVVHLVVPEYHLVEQRRQVRQQRQTLQPAAVRSRAAATQWVVQPVRLAARPRRRPGRRRLVGRRQAASDQVLQHERPQRGQTGVRGAEHVLGSLRATTVGPSRPGGGR